MKANSAMAAAGVARRVRGSRSGSRRGGGGGGEGCGWRWTGAPESERTQADGLLGGHEGHVLWR